MSGKARARLLAAGAVAGAAVAGLAAPTHAATAVESGWWTASPLLAPDAPSDSLVVQGGPAGALAYGAVRYALAPDEVPETLTLSLADGAASTPDTTVMLCPLTEPFTPAQGGPLADAPAFDCETAVEASPSDDGATYRFDVGELARDGALAVAVLPMAPTDRLVLAVPGPDSLATAEADTAMPGSDELPAADVTTDGAPARPTAPARPSPFSPPRAPQPVAAAPARVTPEVAAAPPVAAPPSVAAAPAAQVADPSRNSWVAPALFVSLAAVAARLWLGGRPDDQGADPQFVPQPGTLARSGSGA